MSNRPSPSAFDVSNALWNECALAFDFINSGVREALCGPDGGARPLPLAHAPGWWRAVAWLSSLSRLQSPSDFQAVFAAARALLEITVDAVLLQHELDAPARQRDWETSAKFKHANAIAQYYAGRSAPRNAREAIRYAQTAGARIDALRIARGWANKNGTGRHPDRWTSRNLGDDARAADRFEPKLSLEEIYETKYRELCWYVHGPGAIGIRNTPPSMFPAVGGFMFRTCAQLAVAHARLLLGYAGLWEVPYNDGSWAEHFERLKQAQILVTHAAMFGVSDDERELEEDPEAAADSDAEPEPCELVPPP